ncbi:MAG: sulfatase-like hydrolase/transferase [Acidobacteriota bacterium]
MLRVRPPTLVTILLLAGLSACARSRQAFPGSSIFVISVDTLRSDHLPAYGYRSVETPNIDALAGDGILFEHAYAHVPLTLPSHATLFTGLLPADNGVRDNVAFTLPAARETMAAFFGARGYATGGAVSAVVLTRGSGIARGFDFYDDAVEPTRVRESLGRVQRSGPETAGKLVDWISSRAGETKGPNAARRPLFAFLHIYEPHSPYEPPEPFKSRYRDRPYDGEIASADAVVGAFLAELKSRGLYDGAIVVLLSDHGEGLGDHGEAEHGVFLYREALQVPVILKLPGARRKGERVSAPIGLVDLFPTLAAAAGLAPPAGLAGTPLEPEIFGARAAERAVYSETLYPRFHLGWSDLASLTTGTHQYIEAPRPELYDLRTDTAEKNDLAASRPPEFRRLRLEVARIRKPAPAPGAGDPEQARKLASLGYLTQTAPQPVGPLPDPKDGIGEVEELKTAFGLFSAGEFERAAAHLASLVAKRPSMVDAWQIYAQTLRQLGRDDEALDAFRAADRLAPGNAPLLLEMSQFFLETGKLDDARKYARLAEAAGSPQVHETMARIALASRDLPGAESEARLALGDRPGRRVPLLILAQIARERGDLPGALAHLDELARLTREKNLLSISAASGLRGDILARLGRDAEAEAAFQEEMRVFPENAQAWCNFALFYASQGRPELARRTLLAGVHAAPGAGAYHAAIETARLVGDRETAAFLEREAQRMGQSRRPVRQPAR